MAFPEDMFDSPVEDVTLDDIAPKFPDERGDLSCPECNSHMLLRQGVNGPFYGCRRFPACRGTHNATATGAPVGLPANKVTKDARVRAHAAFDQLWLKGNMTRSAAYRWLQFSMGLTSEQGHIARFDLAMCERLIHLVQIHFDGIEGKKPSLWRRLMGHDPF
jgi:ssDNA-binding Zn-finger/Zn-ribbon topoisomerase 1